MIGVSIPTFALAQSSTITNYYGSAPMSAPPARLNGSVFQSTSDGYSNGMRMARSQAASAPGSSSAAFPNQSTNLNTANAGPLVSSDALSSFATTSGARPYVSPPSVTPMATLPTTPPPADQTQSGSAQFDLGKAISIGSSVLHGFNQLVNASRSSIPTYYGANQMTNSPLNRPDFVGLASASGTGPGFLNGSAGQLFKIGRPLNATEVNLLSNYDVAVIIDKSGSMQTQDCPGGISRWDFCREQLLNLTSQAGAAFRNGITVALFSSDYQIFRNVNFSAVSQIFSSNYPDGGTYLAKPMRDILSSYFAERDGNAAQSMPTRPLLIEIITDGEPSDKGALIQTICQATQKMRSPREVSIQFLQIGHDNEGGKVLDELQNRLVPEDGARYGIVNVEPFDVVLNEGLARSMVTIATH